MADSLRDMFTHVNADGSVQPIIPRLTYLEAPSTADTAIPAGSKTIVPGTQFSVSPDAAALSAFVFLVGACNFDNSGGAGAALGVCELQLNGVARPEFMQTQLGAAGTNVMSASTWALALVPGSVNTLRLAVWKSAAVGAFTAIHPHTKLSGVLFEIFATI